MNGVEFDLSIVTAEEMQVFFEAARTDNNKGMSKVLAKVVSKCPTEWGNQRDAETYLQLPYFTTFKPLIKAFVEEASGKN